MNPFVMLFDKRDWFFDLLLQHIGISLVSIALAAFIGLSIGIGIAQWKRGAKPMLALVNFVYTTKTKFSPHRQRTGAGPCVRNPFAL